MLRALHRTNAAAAKLLNNFATRRRDRRVVEVDRLEQIHPDLTRGEIIDVLKKLDEFHFGQFLVGRRGAPSRFAWDYSMQSVGKAAAGEGMVKAVTPELDEEDEGSLQVIRHEYRLRPDHVVYIDLPEDLTAREAARLAEFLKTLPFES